MARASLTNLMQQIRTLVGRTALGGTADVDLLDRFLSTRDEPAFAELMSRHANLVWGVCRRVLGDDQAAEDVFQATFFLLFRKAGTIRKKESLSSWLYGVAYRLSVRARQRTRRQDPRKLRHSSTPRAEEPMPSDDWKPVLDEEVNRLPDRFRAPIILCYFQGKTNEVAAKELHCPAGTVKSRLAEARQQLRSRLERRGVALSAATVTTALLGSAAEAVPPSELLKSTLQGVLLVAQGKALLTNVLSPASAELVQSGLTYSQRSLVAVAALVIAVGVGLAVHSMQPSSEQPVLVPTPALSEADRARRAALVEGTRDVHLRYYCEIENYLLQNALIQADLEIEHDDARKLDNELKAMRGKQSEALEDSILKDLEFRLRPEQFARLRQLHWQARSWLDPEVHERLRLSPDQVQTLVAIDRNWIEACSRFLCDHLARKPQRKDFSNSMDFSQAVETHSQTKREHLDHLERLRRQELEEMLSLDQRQDWLELTGSPFTCNKGQRDYRIVRVQGALSDSLYLNLLSQDAVRKEIGLTPRQGAYLCNSLPRKCNEWQRDWGKEVLDRIADNLGTYRFERLLQIHMQYRGLVDPDIQVALQWSPDQLARFTALADEFKANRNKSIPRVGKANDQVTADFWKTFQNEVSCLLTPDQQRDWLLLTGPPWAFPDGLQRRRLFYDVDDPLFAAYR